MKHFFKFAIAMFFAFFLIRPAVAVSISYTLDFNENTNSGQYNYTISNDSALYLDAFSIYFDYGLYEGLSVKSLPADWDALTTQPVDYDEWGQFPGELILWSKSGIGLAPEELLTGLSVSFDWLGEAEVPGSQWFDVFILNPVTGEPEVVDSLGAETSDVSVVPEPQTLMLLGTGILALAAYHRRSRSRKKM